MDKKSSPVRRQKRQAKVIEENIWDCSVCTYRNSAEAFKCGMCDVRKGTSTRKPRLNSALAAQQAATLPGGSGNANANATATASGNNMPSNGEAASSSTRHGSSSGHERQRRRRCPARLENVDRSTAQTREVTVNSVTVFITEYKAKPETSRRESTEQSLSESNDSRS